MAILDNTKPLTVSEACKYLGISQGYLYKLTSKRLIKHHKPNGKKIYFFRDEIDEYVRRNPVQTLEEISNKADDFIRRTPIKGRK